MRARSKLVVLSFCLVCLSCLRLSAQDGRNLLLSFTPFERAIVCIKHFEGLHGKDCYPYVGYGHKLQKGERFTAAMTERQADSLLRTDLMKRFASFQRFGKDALLLTVLSYNVGESRLLGNGKRPKSILVRKLESGNRDIYREYVSFCHYKGQVLRGLVKRRKVEFALFYIP
ncbi:lysozyme-related protein [Tannerella forsythia KS16]|mgnify:CR=1 FL=1|uniref:glycoside hydrolase family protein n=1 Tax=Bacteroidales TaxID=171549 RepID=UPI000618AD43|nr:lysozyme [Tannerella forsythia]BAR52475.1 lysozyme-related protein [Tannerella forsythia KS16]